MSSLSVSNSVPAAEPTDRTGRRLSGQGLAEHTVLVAHAVDDVLRGPDVPEAERLVERQRPVVAGPGGEPEGVQTPGAGRRFGPGHQLAPQTTAQERALHVQPEHLGAAHARNRAARGKGNVQETHRVPAGFDHPQLDSGIPQPSFKHLHCVDRSHFPCKGFVDAVGGVGVEEDLGGECAEARGVCGGCSAVDEVFGHEVWGRFQPDPVLDASAPTTREAILASGQAIVRIM